MSGWRNSNRRKRLPANWDDLREAALGAAGYRCEQKLRYGQRCPATTDLEVDHVVAMKDDHSNLQVLCRMHHAEKSAQEGVEARERKRAEIATRFRRSDPHPGSLDADW